MNPIDRMRRLKRLRMGLGAALLLGILIPQTAAANPLGPQVISGQASFSTQGKTLSVTNSDRAIINWQDFSIAGGELTRFIQPTATSAVLNRVIGNNPSAIYGALQSNGRVYLVNQKGIFIGPTATIDVNGLVASTLNITDGDFRAGKINLSGGTLSGTIENQGTIRTPSGGSIYLIAPDVTNSGILHAPNGDVMLAAGKQVSLVESTTPEIAAIVSAPENEALNLGQIIAEAGRIGIYGGLIRHRGIISADSAVMDKTGTIHFRATKDITLDKDSVTTANGPKGGQITVQSAEGTTLVSGAVEAKGSSGQGGTIHLLGGKVGLMDAAQVDASGETGGGTVLAGGDYQGKNPNIRNAEATYFGSEASIKADALTSGDGGTVVVWSDGSTKAYGSISAKGGAMSGNGGLIETSGHQLDVAGADINASATNGDPGTWLLDPYNVSISAGATANGSFGGGSPDIWTPSASGSNIKDTDLSGKLEGGTSVTVNTAGAGAEAGNITVSGTIDWSDAAAAATLTLNAVNDITTSANTSTGSLGAIIFNAGGSITQTGGTLTGEVLTLNAGGSITQTGGTIGAQYLKLVGGTCTLTGAPNYIATLAGNVDSLTLNDSSSLKIGTVNGTTGITATKLTFASNHYLKIDAPVTANTLTLSAPGATTQSATGAIDAGALELLGGGSYTLNNGNNNIGTLAGNVGYLLLINNGALSIGTVDTTNGLNSTGAVTLHSINGGLQIDSNLQANGDIYLGFHNNITSPSGATIKGGLLKLSSTNGSIGLSLAPLQTEVSEIGASSVNGIFISNQGALKTSDGDLVFSGGDVSITANSPLTIGTGGVTSSNGDITLTAGATGAYVTTDKLTLNGLVKANTGNITLAAGSAIIENVEPSAPSGQITRTPWMNGQRITCPTGQQLVGNTCVPITCPTGQQLVGNTCEPITCPTGQQLVGNTCQPITCPTGQQLVNNVCQPITCPTGQQLVGNVCQPIVCPTGQQLVNNVCQPITCPTGQQLVGNLCQPIICTMGQVLVGNMCTCPGGMVFTGAGCQCPAGTVNYAGVCKTPSIVPGTGSSTIVYFPATEKLNNPLDVLMNSIINAVDPSVFTNAGPPGGGAGDDPNKPKKNYCN